MSRYEEIARTAVAELTTRRARLGRFAVSDEALISLYAVWVHNQSGKGERFYGGHEINPDMKLVVRSLLVKKFEVFAKSEGAARIQGELNFWVGDTNGYATAGFTTATVDDIIDREDFCKLVYASDESHHDYIAVGILNPEMIERCVAEGVDASLAASTVLTWR